MQHSEPHRNRKTDRFNLLKKGWISISMRVVTPQPQTKASIEAYDGLPACLWLGVLNNFNFTLKFLRQYADIHI